MTTEKGGRPRLFQSPAEMKTRIEEYFAWAKKEKKPLTISRLACFLGCDRQDILRYEKSYGKEYYHTIRRAKQFILADKEERLNEKDGVKTGIIFDLKNNHGFRDSQDMTLGGQVGSPVEISILPVAPQK